MTSTLAWNKWYQTPPQKFSLASVGPDMSRFRRLAKEGSWIVAGQFLAVGGTLGLVRVLTEYLNPAEYGLLTLGLTASGLINQLVMGGLANGIGRYYAIAVEKRDLWNYLRASRQLMAMATCVVAAIGVFSMTALAGLSQDDWLMLLLAALVYAVLSGYNVALSGIQNAARHRRVVALHAAMDAWLKIGLAVGVMWWLGFSSVAVVWGFALSAALVTASQLYYLRRMLMNEVRQNALPQNDWMRQIWTFSWPFSSWGLFTWAHQASDRWALSAFTDREVVGQFAVLFQLGYSPIVLATGLLMAFAAPVLYQRSGDATDLGRNAGVHNLTWRIASGSLFVTLLGFIVTMSLHEFLFGLLVAIPYRSLSHWLPWLVLSGGLFATGQILGLKLMANMQPQRAIVVKTGTAILGIAFNLLGAAYYGLAGIVVSLVVFSLVYLILMVPLAKKLT